MWVIVSMISLYYYVHVCILCVSIIGIMYMCVLYTTGGIALYTVEARKPVRVLQSHSVISNPDDVKVLDYTKVSISCIGDGSSAVGQWKLT